MTRPGGGSPSDRAWAFATHLSLPMALAFPLVVVLWRGDRSPYVAHHATEALNFQTTVLLACGVCTLLASAGVLLLPAVLLGAVVLAVRAARASSRGAWHRYPWILRFVS